MRLRLLLRRAALTFAGALLCCEALAARELLVFLSRLRKLGRQRCAGFELINWLIDYELKSVHSGSDGVAVEFGQVRSASVL